MDKGRTQVDEGVKMAAKTGDSIDRIQIGSQQVLSAIEEISSALREQSNASEQIAQSVEKIAQMSETNGAAVNLISQSANQLEKFAGDLKASVDRFKV
jgi:methyl-accepting chemotaxis protein